MKRILIGTVMLLGSVCLYAFENAKITWPEMPALDFSFARREQVKKVDRVRTRLEPGKAVLVIQGGCLTADLSELTPQAVQLLRETLEDALKTGEGEIRSGRDAVHVVNSVLAKLEDSGVFEAGKGGGGLDRRLEACLHNGSTGKPSYVLGSTVYPNPSRLAASATGQAFMVGADADNFGRALQLPSVRQEYFSRRQIRWTSGPEADHCPLYGPVGVVCMVGGQLAAGSSGALYPHQTPIALYGTLADREVAVVCTGSPFGPAFMAESPAQRLQHLVTRERQPLERAAETVIIGVIRAQAENAGVIALDAQQNLAVSYSSKGFAHAWLDIDLKTHVSVYPDVE